MYNLLGPMKPRPSSSMASFSDLPIEVAGEIIEAFHGDLIALKACSLACRSLLPLCRPFIFRSIEFIHRPLVPPYRPRDITLFGRLLDSNPSISDHVRNLVYEIQPQDLDDDDVPRTLKKFRRLRSFLLMGGNAVWDTLRQPFRESLSHIILLRSITSLEISYLRVFPIALFSLCLNLTTLVIIHVYNDSTDEHRQEYPMLNVVPRLESFTFGISAARYTAKLVSARRSNNLPVLDFRNIRSLSVNADHDYELPAIHALLKLAEKLETLEYTGGDSPYLFRGFAALMNPASLLTLKKFTFHLEINDEIQDPLCGLADELHTISGANKIEEIILYIQVQTDCRCTADDRWGALDTVLAKGFPMLQRVSIHISIATFSSYSDGLALQKELDRLPADQFRWLFKSLKVGFKFSTEVILI